MSAAETLSPFLRNGYTVPLISKIRLLSAATLNKNYSTKNDEVVLETKPYKLHRLDSGPNPSVTLSRTDALEMYEKMVVIRRMENEGSALYKAMLIRGFLHLCAGQEAVVVGVNKEIRQDKDTVTGGYRIHGWAYILGVSVAGVLAELTFRKTGCSRAKGGSMHMYTKNLFGGNAIVGAQLPMGTGSGLAHKLRNNGAISWVLYGDGSANQGQGFEAMNMAKLWGLPVVYLCENNHYGMGTRDVRAAANVAFYTRGDLIPGVWADGMDVISAREAARFAVEYVTSTQSPIILEMDTYRYFGHSMSDPGLAYRTRQEVQEVRKTRDPINTFKKKMISNGLATEDEIKKIDAKVVKEVRAAAEKAKTDPHVDVSDLTNNVYKLCLEQDNLIRGRIPIELLTHQNIP